MHASPRCCRSRPAVLRARARLLAARTLGRAPRRRRAVARLGVDMRYAYQLWHISYSRRRAVARLGVGTGEACRRKSPRPAAVTLRAGTAAPRRQTRRRRCRYAADAALVYSRYRAGARRSTCPAPVYSPLAPSAARRAAVVLSPGCAWACVHGHPVRNLSLRRRFRVLAPVRPRDTSAIADGASIARVYTRRYLN